ncbi:Uncharacterized protein Fot_21261 [Forsythia ovata]|uniref:Uncharacterized protein n=1 Tax=Forsythia ovata TaxID=205694 RepID=A0ABD1UUC5_9LAMI
MAKLIVAKKFGELNDLFRRLFEVGKTGASCDDYVVVSENHLSQHTQVPRNSTSSPSSATQYFNKIVMQIEEFGHDPMIDEVSIIDEFSSVGIKFNEQFGRILDLEELSKARVQRRTKLLQHFQGMSSCGKPGQRRMPEGRRLENYKQLWSNPPELNSKTNNVSASNIVCQTYWKSRLISTGHIIGSITYSEGKTEAQAYE